MSDQRTKTVAEEQQEQKAKTRFQRRIKQSDKLKIERAKDYIRFPAKRPAHAIPIDLRRVTKLSDLPNDD